MYHEWTSDICYVAKRCDQRLSLKLARRGRGSRVLFPAPRYPPHLRHRHATTFYFCCFHFFYMKVHSVIHARGIAVFLLFACAVYIYFGYLLCFPEYKTRVSRVLFWCLCNGCGGGSCSQFENYSLPTRAPNHLSVISVCYELRSITFSDVISFAPLLITLSVLKQPAIKYGQPPL